MLSTIWLVLIVSVSLYCISTSIKPLENGRNPRGLLAGILGLAYVALHLHATYSVIFASLPHPAILFRLAGAIVGGMWVTMLLPRGYRQGAKTMLIISGILFAAPLALVLCLHLINHKVALQPIFTSPNIYIVEAWPVGLVIPAIILLWQSGRNDSKSADQDGGQTDVEQISECGTEA